MDFSQFAALLQGTKTIADLLSASIEARDQLKVAELTAELHDRIARANSAVLDIQSKYLVSVEKCAALLEESLAMRERIAEITKRASEADNYLLAELATNCWAYRIKPEKQGSDRPHYLCQPCYDKGVKSVLGCFLRLSQPAWLCPNCHNEYPPSNFSSVKRAKITGI